MAARPVVLIVRDGWGRNPNPEQDRFNAVKLARTPHGDRLLASYPWTLIRTSGEAVGLPAGTMGNSEVGHQNLGAGRVVGQESVRITTAIRSGEFFRNRVLIQAVTRGRENGCRVHLMGLGSEAGVHGLISHLYACLELCQQVGQKDVAVHLFTDGRDTGPFEGKALVAQVAARCEALGVGRIASVCGRYYAMDRDNRWDRVRRAYQMLTGEDLEVPRFGDTAQAVQDYYDHPTEPSQQGDEFITPRVVGSNPEATRIRDGDSVIFYNYRGDRPRQLTRAFTMDPFYGQVPPSPESGEKGFERAATLELFYVTMTTYDEALDDLVRVAYPKPPRLTDIAGAYLAKLGLTQFRCAETEKFPHVTFFFNDYREGPFDGESWRMVQSPRVPTYDLQPEMSAFEVRDHVLSRVRAGDCEDFILVNFANGDMVGHTGHLGAAVKAVETVDQCVGQIVNEVLNRAAGSGKVLVTADHGNAEQMFDPDTQSPHTAHTLDDVECIIVDSDLDRGAKLHEGGRLADVFPTVLALMGRDQPASMTGQSLIC